MLRNDDFKNKKYFLKYFEKNFLEKLDFLLKNGDFWEKMIFLTPKMNFSGYGYLANYVPRKKWGKYMWLMWENVCVEKKL